MKKGLFVLALMLCVRGANAQERLPDDEAKKIAKELIEASSKVKGPVAVDADADKPFAKRKDEHGAMVVPARKLTAEMIEKAGAEIVPIGLLYFHQLAPLVDEKPVPAKQMKSVSFTHGEKEVTLSLCYLGVQKVKGTTSLVILGNDKKPLVSAPLTKIDEKQELPIEFLVSIEPDETASISVTLLGKHKAKVKVGVPKE